MNIEQKQVREFMALAKQELPLTPFIPSLEVRMLRARLLLEETLETIHNGLGLSICMDNLNEQFRETGEIDIAKLKFTEVHAGNIIEIADGCADIKVVTDGCALACGIDLEPIMAEVGRSNLSKFIDGHRREDGKWVKGPSYSPANLIPILEAQHQIPDPV